MRPICAVVIPCALLVGCGDDGMNSSGASTTGTAGSSGAGSTSSATGEPTTGGSATTTAPTSTDGDTGAPVGCVVFVHGATGDDGMSGASWELAKRTVTAGLDEAEARALGGEGPCEVWVAAGTYRPAEALDVAASFVLRKDIALYGGFVGGESSLDARDWAAHETILSGEFGDPSDPEDNVRHVVIGADGARLDGFTVTGGHARGEPIQRTGGGVESGEGHLTIANCTISGNRSGDGLDDEVGTVGGAAGVGAGVHVTAGSLTLLDSRILDNRGGIGGAGTGLAGIGGVGGEGAGVAFMSGVDLVIRNTTFAGNRAGDGGPGDNIGGPGGSGAGLMIIGAAGDVRVEGAEFHDNISGAGGSSLNLGGGGGGGAMLVNGATGETVIARSIFHDNVAGGGGSSAKQPGPAGSFGGMVLVANSGGAGAMTVASSRFESNEADAAGGLAVLAEGFKPAAPVTILNCAISGNSVKGSGAGLFLRSNGSRAVTVANTTVAGNDAGSNGGGILYQSQESMGAEPARLINSIVWGNTALADPAIVISAFNLMKPVPLEVDVSAIEGGCAPGPALTCGMVLTDPPSFVDLAGGDVHLAPGSKLIDAGDDALAPADLADLDADGDVAEAMPVDLGESPRFVGAAIDLGAYEAR